MILHLVPYEKVYLSTTMDVDEATAVLKILKDSNSSDSTIEKFIHLLDSGIVRAEKYKGNFK
jgi:hypothetical protein